MPLRKKGEEEPPPVETLRCVVCTEPIPRERALRKSVTCSEQHAELLYRSRRVMRDQTRCRLCNRPTTPEEIASYRAWRRATEGELRGRKKTTAANPEVEDEGESVEPKTAEQNLTSGSNV